MRVFRQLRLALEAEALRLRHHARRTVMRVVFGYLALVMVFAALVFAHVAVWFWLRDKLSGQGVALILMGGDLLLAAILGALAARSEPGRVELEALEVRRRAIDDAAASMNVMSMFFRVFDLAMSARKGK